MKVVIVSRGRGPARQHTSDALRGVGFMSETLCHPDDLKRWPDWRATAVDHDWIFQIRQHAIDISSGKILMLDDDFGAWGKRREDGRFTKASTEELTEAFKEVEALLDRYPLVGIGQRYMANTRPDLVLNGRINGALGINVDRLKSLGVGFRRKVMEDFDLVLQLLTRGQDVMTYSKVVYEQAQSGTDGGCSTYRTSELHDAGAEELRAAFPRFVRVVEKVTKGSWGGGIRKDVVVAWKKAREAGNESL